MKKQGSLHSEGMKTQLNFPHTLKISCSNTHVGIREVNPTRNLEFFGKFFEGEQFGQLENVTHQGEMQNVSAASWKRHAWEPALPVSGAPSCG